jgi:hypothetical protein
MMADNEPIEPEVIGHGNTGDTITSHRNAHL